MSEIKNLIICNPYIVPSKYWKYNREKRKFESENPLINVLGKSLVTTQDIKSGTVIDESMLTTKGPFEGIPASENYNVIGKKLKNEKKADQILFIEDFD